MRFLENYISKKHFFVAMLLLGGSFLSCFAQTKSYPAISLKPFEESSSHWYNIKNEKNIIDPMPGQAKYAETEITDIADNIVLFQHDNGGWAKNYDIQIVMTDEQRNKVIEAKKTLLTTFDNATTYTHVEYLAKIYTLTGIEKYKNASIKGLEFCLSAQYANGGWPQQYPYDEKGYNKSITYNDGAFIGIMNLLKKITDNDNNFSFLSNDLRERAVVAYEKGIECVLNTQIVDNGQLTAWCQQHNEVTLKPTWARAFEPASICNGESSNLVLFLMSIDHPNKRIIQSIESAVKWFNDSKILNTRVVTVTVPAQASDYKTITTDRIVIADSTAKPIWTRYYELGTHRPLFCDRDSKLRYSLSEVSLERRSGYGWYTYAPQTVLKQYPGWKQKYISSDNSNETFAAR